MDKFVKISSCSIYWDFNLDESDIVKNMTSEEKSNFSVEGDDFYYFPVPSVIPIPPGTKIPFKGFLKEELEMTRTTAPAECRVVFKTVGCPELVPTKGLAYEWRTRVELDKTNLSPRRLKLFLDQLHQKYNALNKQTMRDAMMDPTDIIDD